MYRPITWGRLSVLVSSLFATACASSPAAMNPDTGPTPDAAVAPDASRECSAPAPLVSVPVDSSCVWAPTPGDFDPVIEWSMATFDEFPEYNWSKSTPIVGSLTDDDADGAITAADIPDIVLVNYNAADDREGVLRVVSGDGSRVHYSRFALSWEGLEYHPYRYALSAIGDIDNDSQPEIVTILYRDNSTWVAALSADGMLEWVNSTPLPRRGHAPAIADLDGDGAVEVVVGATIINGADGTLRASGSAGQGYYDSYRNSGFHAVPVDLDNDGIMEVVTGSTVYDANAAIRCETSFPDGYPSVANLDDDDFGEFVVTGNHSIRIFEHDCTLVREFPTHLLDPGPTPDPDGGRGGPATIADFDGDGVVELGVAAEFSYTLYEVDGTVVWSNPVFDTSESTGSAVFDFDGDGRAEVVYGDEDNLFVWDGATGAVLLQETTHSNETTNENPTIADVDLDGNAEIIAVRGGTATGLYVMGDASDSWVSARPVWNQASYFITNINDDLTVPSMPANNWSTYNNFRQASWATPEPDTAPDLQLVTASLCRATCESPIQVYLQVGNAGTVRAGLGLQVGVYGVAADDSRTLISTDPIEANIESGATSAVITREVLAADVAGYVSLVVIVDDGAGAHECSEDNNEAVLTLADTCAPGL